ncbi:MAG: sodium/solute symporter [Armatimonadetes bacterium]|nr:sodium/solute symporter [Armatimonadota bacterium]
MGTLNSLDVGIILGSLALVVLVGLWAARNQDKTARGYFLASGKLPWYIIGAAFVSTSVSSEQIVGTVGATYKNGMGIANWELWTLPVYTILLVVFIPMYLRNRIATVPEFLSKRFGPLCGDVYSWIMLFAYIVVFMVPVLYGGSLAFSELTGWNFYLVLWGIVILMAMYTVKGGLRSVMFTDALQCLMLVGGGVILFFVALAKIPGGWAAMEQANPSRFHLYHPPSDPNTPFLGMILGSVGVFLFYQSTNQVMIQRVLGARSVWDGMMGIVFASYINLFRPLVTCLLGLIVYHWINVMHMQPPEGVGLPSVNQDLTFPFALKSLAPQWGLRGVILAGFLAAVMGATSAQANSTATIFSLNVYNKFFNKDATERQLIIVGRMASGLALAIAALIAPSVAHFGGIFNYFQTGVTYLATPFISVILLGVLWRRTNYQGAMFGLVGGLVIQGAVAIGLPRMGIDLHWLYNAAIAQAIIICGVVIVSLATHLPDPSRWKPFQWTPAMLASYDEGVTRPWYKSLVLWYGLFAVIWILIYYRFW